MHFAYRSYLLKVWSVKTHGYLPKQTRSAKRNMAPSYDDEDGFVLSLEENTIA
jgi:hypothetical protein